MKEIYLVRHGETLLNSLNRVQGWIDSPLTEKGEEQARQLGQLFKKEDRQFSAVFASDRGRALATAQEILIAADMTHHQVQPMKEWREFGFGQFEGQSNYEVINLVLQEQGYENMAQAKLSRKEFRRLITETIPQLDKSGYAENGQVFMARLQEALEQVVEHLHKFCGNRALVVTHGVVMEQLLTSLAPELDLPTIQNGQVLILDYADGSFYLSSSKLESV